MNKVNKKIVTLKNSKTNNRLVTKKENKLTLVTLNEIAMTLVCRFLLLYNSCFLEKYYYHEKN